MLAETDAERIQRGYDVLHGLPAGGGGGVKANDHDLAREGWLRDWCTIPTNARLRADDAARRGFDAGANWQREQPCPRAEALAECQTERDSLAAQVAMLREGLEENKFFDEDSGNDDDLCRYCMSVVNNHTSDCPLVETTATTWLEARDREQRLAGAWEFYDRLDHNAGPDEVLAHMEREASRLG